MPFSGLSAAECTYFALYWLSGVFTRTRLPNTGDAVGSSCRTENKIGTARLGTLQAINRNLMLRGRADQPQYRAARLRDSTCPQARNTSMPFVDRSARPKPLASYSSTLHKSCLKLASSMAVSSSLDVAPSCTRHVDLTKQDKRAAERPLSHGLIRVRQYSVVRSSKDRRVVKSASVAPAKLPRTAVHQRQSIFNAISNTIGWLLQAAGACNEHIMREAVGGLEQCCGNQLAQGLVCLHMPDVEP